VNEQRKLHFSNEVSEAVSCQCTLICPVLLWDPTDLVPWMKSGEEEEPVLVHSDRVLNASPGIIRVPT